MNLNSWNTTNRYIDRLIILAISGKWLKKGSGILNIENVDNNSLPKVCANG